MRHGMPSEGHLAGARQLQWQQLFQGDSGSAHGEPLKSRPELAKLYADRMQPGDTVVTYCWVGYRASTTYLAARALGLPVKLYDGSYEDWARRKLPLTTGAKP
jgi:thiosulfate/3-mercaptopyruvate sulfurtransferase